MIEITIDNFQGPLDLLLHLIKKSQMDIFNVKLEVIIDEYLKYIEEMQGRNLDIASSYLVMSCELLEIKSRMLLPSYQEEKEEEDPKDALIRRLVEYQKYKDQIDSFKNLEEERNTYFTKLPSSIEEYRSNTDTLSHTMDVDDLVKAFESFLERSREDKPINTKVTKKELSVDDRINDIRERIKYNHAIPFFDLFEIKTKEYIVVTFLAILELAKKHELIIKQENNFGEIICEGINEV